MTHLILIERLLEHVDPFFGLGWAHPKRSDVFISLKVGTLETAPTLAEVERHRPVSQFVSLERRDRAYHLGRIAHFVQALRRQAFIDPIELDNECSQGNIYPQAILLDGHHRVLSAFMIGHPTLLATYGGRIDVLEWLTGQREHAPLD